jgi:release factor glutamine methyltransferase
MRTADVLRRGTDYLARHGVEAPGANAEALLENVLGLERTALLTTDREPNAVESRAFGRALCRRASGTPLQHLTGAQAFRHLTLRVRPGVFVPRPETEVLVDVALVLLANATRPMVAPVVADVCTGTGAIALAIAQERPDATVIASDVSAEAVALARENAEALGLAVQVRDGDLLEPIDGPLDLVTCNPPYIPIEARGDLPREVLADPGSALFGGPEFVARLFGQAQGRLRPGGWVVVEIEESTGDVIGGLAVDAGFDTVSVHPDLAGRPRVMAARRP